VYGLISFNVFFIPIPNLLSNYKLAINCNKLDNKQVGLLENKLFVSFEKFPFGNGVARK